MRSIIDFAARWIDRIADSYRVQPWFLGVIRILFAAHVLFFGADYQWTAEVPASFFQARPGIFGWLTGPPDTWMVIALEVLRAVLALTVLVGFKTFPASIALTVVMILGAGLTHSFGKVDHFILYELFPAFMAFAGWNAALSIDARMKKARASEGFPMLLWALTIAFGMFSAALPKVFAGWLDPSREASRGFIARDLVEDEKLGPMVDFIFSIDSAVFWKFMDYATILAEGWLIVAVLFPVAFRVGIAIMLMFHIGVYLSLGIDFSDYIFIYAVFFGPVASWIYNRVNSKKVGSRPSQPSPAS